MDLKNIKKAPNYKVENWLKKSIKELTPYQKSKIYEDEIVRFAPFEFYEKKDYVPSVWLRLSIVLIPFAWILLIIGLPFTFIINGRWGYGKRMNWILDWFESVKL